MNTLTTLRSQLVECRADQRIVKQELERLEAQSLLQAPGSNAEQRKANVVLMLAVDADYQRWYGDWLKLTREIEQIEAEIENERDQRRERAIKLRLVEALEKNGQADDSADPFDTAGDDEAFWQGMPRLNGHG